MDETILDEREGKPSASGMQRIALCPGSWLAERGCPDETSEAAETGTRLHKHMEDGTTPDDAEEAEAVAWCREQERLLAEKYLGLTIESQPDVVSVVREVRWWAADGSFSGKGDVVYVCGDRALVLDYKFGRTPVPVAANNLQLAAMGQLAFDNLPGVKEVFCGLLQPYASRQEPRLVRYRLEEAMQLRQFLKGVVTAAGRPDARRVPGEEQCRYCKAKTTCPACNTLVARATQVDVATAWPDWTPERKSEALRVAGLAKRWAEAVERKAKADLKEGFPIPGFSLGAGKSMFKITDTQGAFGQLNALIGLTGEEFAGCCTVKISALDKVVHKRLAEQAPEGRKQLVKKSAEWLREVLEEYGSINVSEGSIKEVTHG